MWLDERCTQGERDNAKSLYEKLLSKFSLTDADIAVKEKITDLYWFDSGTRINQRLIYQILAKTLEPEKAHTFTSRLKPKCIGCYLTADEYKIVESKYKVLRKSLKKELEFCYHAFVLKNNLGTTPDKERDLTDEERDELEKILRYMTAIPVTHVPEMRRERLLK
jgi:hypothetical protein